MMISMHAMHRVVRIALLFKLSKCCNYIDQPLYIQGLFFDGYNSRLEGHHNTDRTL